MGTKSQDLQESLEFNFELLLSCLSPQQRSDMRSIIATIRTAWVSLIDQSSLRERPVSDPAVISEKSTASRDSCVLHNNPIAVDIGLLGTSELTPRQMEVFCMIGQAMGTSDIAKQLHLSIHTVESHRENIKRKLGITNSQELIRAAVLFYETLPDSQKLPDN